MPPSLAPTSYKSKSEAELAWQIGCRWSYSSSSSSDSSSEGSSDGEFISHQNKSKYGQQNKTATIARNQRKNQNSINSTKDNHKHRSQSDQLRNTQTRSNEHDAEDETYLSHPHHQMITRDYQYSHHPQRNVDNICYENNDMNDSQDNNNGLDNDAQSLSNNDETTAVCNNPKKNMVMEKPCCSNNTTFPHAPAHTSPCRAPEAELERSIRQYPASHTHKPLPGGIEETEGYNEERSNISRATTKLTESCHEVHAGQNQRLNRGKDFHGQGKPSTSNFPPQIGPEIRLHKQHPKTTAAPTSHNTLDRKSVRSVRDHFNGLDVHHNNLHVEECALDENSSFSCGLCCNGTQNCIAAQNTISPVNYGCTMNAQQEMIRSNFEMNTKDHIIVNEAMVSCADNMLINKSANGICDSDSAAFCVHDSKNAPFCVPDFKNGQFCVHDSKQSNSSTDSGFTDMASAELYSHQYMMNNHCLETNRGEIIVDNDNYQDCNCPNCLQQQLAGNNPQNFMGSQSFCCNFNSATGTAASRGKFIAGGAVSNCCSFPMNRLTTTQNSTLLLQHNHLSPLHHPSEINCPGLICKHSGCGGELIHNQQIINNNSGNVVNSDHNNHFVHHDEDGQDKYWNEEEQQLLAQKQIGSSCIQSKRLLCTKTVTRTNDPHQQYFEDDSKLTTTSTQQQFGQCVQLLTDGLARSSGDYAGEGTHVEQDNHDDNAGGNMGVLENKDSYDSDSSSEEEIGHIIGKFVSSYTKSNRKILISKNSFWIHFYHL